MGTRTPRETRGAGQAPREMDRIARVEFHRVSVPAALRALQP